MNTDILKRIIKDVASNFNYSLTAQEHIDHGGQLSGNISLTPIRGYLNGDVDLNKLNELRSILESRIHNEAIDFSQGTEGTIDNAKVIKIAKQLEYADCTIQAQAVCEELLSYDSIDDLCITSTKGLGAHSFATFSYQGKHYCVDPWAGIVTEGDDLKDSIYSHMSKLSKVEKESIDLFIANDPYQRNEPLFGYADVTDLSEHKKIQISHDSNTPKIFTDQYMDNKFNPTVDSIQPLSK
ncbi:MAG: hypothetical protein EP298_02230 [Gammaproteobacteria bacterium]|nr:MAG: hypothetical protein EP298_02230 [Gammaproteobacteria bacterium]UTW43624.1 hypothetical protein KFE69_05915 [bacterium SCSIO 12844]